MNMLVPVHSWLESNLSVLSQEAVGVGELRRKVLSSKKKS